MGLRKRCRQISCQFCRTRKLRCSREFPCSNCTSRGVPCLEPQPQPQRNPPAHRPAAEKVTTPAKHTDFLNRLERLETFLVVQNKRPESGHEPSAVQQPTARPVHTLRFHQPLQPSVQDLTNDALFLELSCLSTGLSVSRCIYQVLNFGQLEPMVDLVLARNRLSRTTSSSARALSGSSHKHRPMSFEIPVYLCVLCHYSPPNAYGYLTVKRLKRWSTSMSHISIIFTTSFTVLL
jgi:hypothetical protein